MRKQYCLLAILASISVTACGNNRTAASLPSPKTANQINAQNGQPPAVAAQVSIDPPLAVGPAAGCVVAPTAPVAPDPAPVAPSAAALEQASKVVQAYLKFDPIRKDWKCESGLGNSSVACKQEELIAMRDFFDRVELAIARMAHFEHRDPKTILRVELIIRGLADGTKWKGYGPRAKAMQERLKQLQAEHGVIIDLRFIVPTKDSNLLNHQLAATRTLEGKAVVGPLIHGAQEQIGKLGTSGQFIITYEATSTASVGSDHRGFAMFARMSLSVKETYVGPALAEVQNIGFKPY